MTQDTTQDPITDLVNAPWYQSTAGPGVSSTLTNLATTLIPVANLALASAGINLLPAQINGWISVAVFLFFSVKVAIRYVQTKHMFGTQIGRIQRSNTDLANALKESDPNHPVLSRGGY